MPTVNEMKRQMANEVREAAERRGDPNGIARKAGHYWTCGKCHYLNDASIRFNRCGGCGEVQKGYADPRPGEPT